MPRARSARASALGDPALHEVDVVDRRDRGLQLRRRCESARARCRDRPSRSSRSSSPTAVTVSLGDERAGQLDHGRPGGDAALGTAEHEGAHAGPGNVAALTSPSPTPSSVTKPAFASASSTSGSLGRRRALSRAGARARRSPPRAAPCRLRVVLPSAVRSASAFLPSPPRFQGSSSHRIPGTVAVGLAQQRGLRLHHVLVDAALGDDRDRLVGQLVVDRPRRRLLGVRRSAESRSALSCVVLGPLVVPVLLDRCRSGRAGRRRSRGR